ncbi:4-(cytidine 5'-diphospho)-2-C-methyl-D-erythritol kinase [Jiella mangrovi]|uniref:4-diphosphocytidyl-2-C-methyl-D-erythritol kinase n=1 Tax=Jiella mangrovi TaxID=2821407 RepID=A0ABS4BKQ0_9HYPH|nr:4-(cytidine 5'-diphospho)-2-C-methyl-D-erythritol kinase [Jiella mangrovi]MBP0616744.1 4-(cytidine 5'-diphospho)-2-C-methyl-D-erythritol kinase [Jiella mangrovi]
MHAATVGSRTRFAPAKVNLALHIVGQRDDGYHRLESLVVFDETAGDTVMASPLVDQPSSDPGAPAQGATDRLSVDGPFAQSVPLGADNILLKAAALAREEFAGFGIDLPPLDIRLSKNLPVAAGIGGGSADAAALLGLVSASASEDLRAALGEKAVRLGADVPMCLANRPALVTGIGETITPLAGMPKLSMLLVNPGIAVETASVFRMLASRENPAMPSLPGHGFAGLDDLVSFLSECRNDLALAAGSLAPEIERARGRLIEAGALFARMSGSGATVFGLFADDDARDEAGRRIARDEPGWWLSRNTDTETQRTTR